MEESIRNFDNAKILRILTENVEGFER
jgi:hypothetical protein